MAFPTTVRLFLYLLAAALLSLCASHARAEGNPVSRIEAAPRQTGFASWYGYRHNGRRTANGEIHDSQLLTAAHRGLPFGTLVKVTNLKSGTQVMVRINDRGPYVLGRVIDLSEGAARRLGMLADGLAPVSIEVVAPRG